MLVLDQLSDPHNVGAILRTAAAFGVTAVVVQDRHAPPQSGALAKAASGALDIVPYVEVVNIARALDELAEARLLAHRAGGRWRAALAEAVPQAMWRWCWARKAPASAAWCANIASRRLHSDLGKMESLNVSNAAAIALYELRRWNLEPDSAVTCPTSIGRIYALAVLWAIGIPLPIIIILWLVTGHA